MKKLDKIKIVGKIKNEIIEILEEAIYKAHRQRVLAKKSEDASRISYYNGRVDGIRLVATLILKRFVHF